MPESCVNTSRADAHPDRAWREAVSGLAAATLAHAPEWHTAIRNAYGHEPLYLHAEADDGRRGVLPAFVVRRPLLGSVVTSMPFLDTGGPCAPSPALDDSLLERLVAEARRLGATAVELRGTRRLNLPIAPMEHKVSMTLPLPSDESRLWRDLDGSVRNQIRKAERSGLTVELAGAEGLDDFYAIHAARMADLGSPVHARPFFTAVFDAFGRSARVVVVRKERTAIGGLIAIAFKDMVAVPWAACLPEFFALCPNMLMYWVTIQQACFERFARFEFGRSTRGSGTYFFKRQWGAREEPLYWYTIPLTARRRRPAPAAAARGAMLARSWRRLPLAVTRRLGPRIRRYLTQ